MEEMNHIDREKVKQAFASYTAGYNSDDPKIKLKIDHTYRVAELCDMISETVRGADRDLAWLCGMLHDVGRFEQVKRYNTFADAKSVDHAQFGADLLFNEKLVDSFGTFCDEWKDILEVSIRNHNKFKIDEGLSDEYLEYCQILRDADKIDILRVNIDAPPEEIYNVSSENLRRSAVSDAVKQGFREKHAILRSLRQTPADIMVGHICMVNELVYPISIRIAREQGYLATLLEFDSENVDTNEWFAFMRATLRKEGFI